jgi:hypothetical protein
MKSTLIVGTACFAICAAVTGCKKEAAPSPTNSKAADTAPAEIRAPAAPQTAPTSEPEAGAAPAPAPAPTDDKPEISRIRDRYREIQSDTSLQTSAFKIDCARGESDADVQLFQKQGTLHKALLTLNLAGDAGQPKYEFYYADGKPVFILVNDRNWVLGAANADPENPNARELELRYYFEASKPILCTRKVAEAPAKAINALLEKTAAQPDDCAKASKAYNIGLELVAGEAKAKTRLKPILWGANYCK